jgi:hypothetical protein
MGLTAVADGGRNFSSPNDHGLEFPGSRWKESVRPPTGFPSDTLLNSAGLRW